MDPLHAAIEEFAADGYTHIECHCQAMPRHPHEADQLASSHFDGTHYRSAVSTAALCRTAAANCNRSGPGDWKTC